MSDIHVSLKMSPAGRTEVEVMYPIPLHVDPEDVAEFWYNLMKHLTDRGLNPTRKRSFMQDDSGDDSGDEEA